ncbi:hypothetical protein [Streptomyces sp. UNOC14_S4]|uniref:hypothetical protein n=1 Tax=Streptomyces sp. UNOC14_S4 TaxID=2872340 RepID=UPI001E2D036C|nr:hypothetical protein [Streptomyces sp. UNOC14_S4]MCC3768273.1 hypothetical protein [Streptomyces sp. UNOC14_S4]
MNRFLDHTGGVLALVSLTATVVWGLIATGRLLLGPRARLLAQAVHRATAVCALGFLLTHIAVKVAEAHAAPVAALVPFTSGVRGAGGLIGLGSLAAYLMVLAGATGALRSSFAGTRGRSHARRWRVLHACAYPAWCAAVLHGLNAGREPAGWVTVCYGLCLAAVAAALIFRYVRVRRGRAAATGPATSAAPATPAAPVRTARTARTAAPGRHAVSSAGTAPAPRPVRSHASGAHSPAALLPDRPRARSAPRRAAALGRAGGHGGAGRGR